MIRASKTTHTDNKKFVNGFSGADIADEHGTDLYIEVKSSVKN